MMLWKLLKTMPAERWESAVVSLRDAGTVGPRIASLQIPVLESGFGHGAMSLGAPLRLRRQLRRNAPQLLQGWMYHGNLAAVLASRLPTLWNIRQSFDGFGREKRLTAMVIRASAVLSSRAARIIYNSATSARQHEAIGFDSRRTIVIPNGFDFDQFRPDPTAGHRLRARFGFPADTVLIGQVARYHPMKNHAGFLRAAAAVARSRPEARFLLAGEGVDDRNEALTSTIVELGIPGQVRLLGATTDMAGLMAGLDLLCSPSGWGEAFPNVLGEAMACAVPCVATDVGDSSAIIGQAGIIVPPGDDGALASAISRLLALPMEERLVLGQEALRQVHARYGIEAVGRQYAALYEETLACAGRGE